MRFVATRDGHAVAVRVEGDLAGDRGVVLLHGLSQQGHFWDPVINRMRTRPIATVDLRGHGQSDVPVGADFSVSQVAADVWDVMDEIGWSDIVLVGHSWGAAVAVAATSTAPDRVEAMGLIDGGLWSMSRIGPRADVREALTPPRLSIPQEQWPHVIRSGSLGALATDEVLDALRPTFTTDSDGNMSTTVGFDRHMAVLDGLLDYDAEVDLDQLGKGGPPGWAIVCDERPASAWQGLKAQAAQECDERGYPLIHRWTGAIHDVPLQWPALVAGWIDSLAATVGFDAHDGRTGGER